MPFPKLYTQCKLEKFGLLNAWMQSYWKEFRETFPLSCTGKTCVRLFILVRYIKTDVTA